MGFFDFFKKMPEKKATTVETIDLKELLQWMNKKSLESNKVLLEKINYIKQEVLEEKEKLRNSLEVLQKSELKNKEIPERAKQLMEGNRNSYIQKVNAFIDKIVFTENPSALLEFTQSFDSFMDSFDKSISKSHRVMEEFFAEKASTVALSIKKIDKSFKDIRELLEKSEFLKIEELKKKIAFLLEQQNKLEQNQLRLTALEDEIENISVAIKQKEAQQSALQKSETYKKAVSLIDSKMSVETEISRLNSRLRHSFSEIEPALKKYENLSQNKIVKKYLEDSVSTLLEDKQLEINSILHAIQNAIIKGEITLKDKKKDKIMNELFTLNADFFKDFVSQRTRLDNALAQKINEIENLQILKELAELEKSLAQDKSLLREKLSASEKIKKEMKSKDMENSIKSLENEIKNKIGLEVKITNYLR